MKKNPITRTAPRGAVVGPTWDEYVELKRTNGRLIAEKKALTEELQEALDDNVSMSERLDQIPVFKKARENADEARCSALNDLQKARTEVVELNRQLGSLEVRLARALGRTYVVSHSDEMATVVGALAQIADYARASLPTTPRPFFAPGDPLEGRLRQIVSICEHTIGKMAKDEPPPGIERKAVEAPR